MWFTKGTPTKSLAPAVYVHILRESVVSFMSCLCVFHANAIYDMIFCLLFLLYLPCILNILLLDFVKFEVQKLNSKFK